MLVRPRSALLLLSLGALSCEGGTTGAGDVLVVAEVDITPPELSLVAGRTGQLHATPKTSSGIQVPNRQVTWSSDDPGIATVAASGLVTGVSTGSTRVNASVDGVDASIPLEVSPKAVATVSIDPPQMALTVGESKNLTVMARDEDGQPLTGRPVTFSSDNLLIASVSEAGQVTGVAPGLTVVTATVEGKSATTNVAVNAMPATELEFANQPATGTAGRPLPALRIAVQNAQGGLVVEGDLPVTLSLADNPTDAVLSGTRTVLTINGVATFADVSVNEAGIGYTLRAASGDLSPAVSAPFAIVAGNASSLTIATQPSLTATSGTPLAQQPRIQLRDANGNAVAQSGVMVTAALEGAGATLGGTRSVSTNAEGLATFSNLTLSGSAGVYTLLFAAPGLTAIASNGITMGAGAPASLILTQQPAATAQSGVALTRQPVVELRDQDGNVVPQSGLAVTAAIHSGGGQLNGTATILTDASGRATFTGLAIAGPTGTRTLRFSASGVAPAISEQVVVLAGPAETLVITTAPPTASSSGAVLSPAPVVQIVDAFGNAVDPDTEVTLTVSIATGNGSLSGTTSVATTSGVGVFSGLILTGPAGSITLRFSGGTLTPVVSGPIVLGAGAPTALTIAIQPPATAESGTELTRDPVILLRDASGSVSPRSGVPITVTIASGGGTLGGTTTRATNAGGQATFDDLVITGTPGIRTLRFASAGLTGVTSSDIDVTAAPAGSLTIVTQPSPTAQSGVPLATQPAITLTNGAGDPVSGSTITAVINSGPAGSSLAGASAVTDAGGVATFTGLAITGDPGDYTLRFESGALSVVSATVTINTLASRLLLATAPAATATSGSVLSTQPAIQIATDAGAPVAQSGITITATIASGPSGATLAGATAVTNGSGLATFSSLTITGPAGTYVLRFEAGTLTPVSSGNITLEASPATLIEITTQPPATAVSGTALSQQPVLALTNAQGGPVSSATITAVIASGPAGSSLTNASAVTSASGVATFSGLAITGNAGDYTLRFQSGALSVNSATVTISPVAGRLVLATAPSGTTTSGAALSTQPRVQIATTAGDPVAQSGTTITAEIAAGPAGATLSGATAVTDGAGLATFSGLTISGATGGYLLRFESSGLTPVSSGTITVGAGAAALLSITTQPATSAVSGTALGRQPVIQVRDQSGNAAAQSGVIVTASIASGGGTLGGTVTRTTGATGAATFTDLEITGSPGPRTLRFSATGLAGVTSGTIDITAAPATSLLLATQPSSTASSGGALSTQPSVQVADAGGDPVAQGGTTVTAVIASGPGGASLTNATEVTNASGRATFSGLAISGLVGTYTLRFQAGSLSPVTSANITLGAGAPQSITMVTQPPTTGVSGDVLAGSSVVLVEDASGNDVSGASVTASVASGNGQLQGTVTRSTASTGRATFNDLALVGPSGSYTLRFSVGGVSVVSRAISLENLAGQGLFIVTQPPSQAERNRDFTRDPRVEIRDSNGDLVEVDAVTITAVLETIAGSGTLGGDAARETSNGVATWPNLKINGTGTFRIRFTSPGRASVTSSLIEVE